MELGAGAKYLKYIKVEKCEYHPEGVKPLIAIGETHGKERLKTIALPDIALLIGTGRRRVILEEVGLCRGMESNPYGKVGL